MAAILRIAGPVALARLGIVAMGITDTMVVGNLAPAALPALALGWAPTAVVLVGGLGLLVGVQVLAARMMGEAKPAQAGMVLRRGLVLGLVAGVLSGGLLAVGAEPILLAFGIAPELAQPAAAVAVVLALGMPFHMTFYAAASFLEGVGRPGRSTFMMWAGNGLNLVLNLLLVPDHGAIGSAWATLGSRALMTGALLAWIWTMKDAALFGLGAKAERGQEAERAAAPDFRALLAIGAAAAISQTAEAGAFSGMTVLAGRIGPEAVAAYQIMLNALSLVFMVALGMSAATGVLVSQAIGAGDRRQADAAGWTGLSINSVLMIAAGIALAMFAQPLAAAYTADVALAALCAALFPLAAFVPLPDGGQGVVAQALRARGDNWFPTGSHLIAYVLLMPPLGYWLGEHQGHGVAGLLAAIIIASVFSVVVLMARTWSLRARAIPATA